MSVAKENKVVHGNDLIVIGQEIKEALAGKQNTLVSGTNIKTINNTSLLGSGDIVIPKGDKGDKGDTGDMGPQGPQGPQGNAGSSVDYPFELVNNLTTDDATKALSAAQGKALSDMINGYTQIDLSTLTKYNISIVPSTGRWGTTSGVYSVFLPVSKGDIYQIMAVDGIAVYSILQNDNHVSGTMCAPASGHGYREPVLSAGENITIEIIESDAAFICFRADTVTTGAPAPTVYKISPLITKAEAEEMINSATTYDSSIDISSYPLEQAAISSTGIWVTQMSGSKGIFVKVSRNDTLTITAGANDAIYAMLTDNSHVEGAKASFASGWSSRKTLSAGTTIEEIVPNNAQYVWFFATADTVSGSMLPSSVESGSGVSMSFHETIDKINERIDEIGANSGDSTYFANSNFTPLSLDSHPLIYEADNKVSTNHICNAVAYPNGIIIAARSGGSIVKIGLDGEETTLLTCSGASDWRGLWMDSNYTVFASPFNSVNNEGSAVDIGNGIYRLPYGSNTFTKVLSLSAGRTIWTFCEDADGYLYGGLYQLLTDEAVLYRSADGGSTWSLIYNFISSGVSPEGRHVHSVVYNEYNNTLYAIIGEVNDILKSTDHGETWMSLGISLTVKGSSMLATPYGLLVGSDGAYFCDIDILLPDDITHKKVSRAWADTIFAIRKSDISNNIYAFCKIDSSVKSSYYYPQMADVSDSTALSNWINSSPAHLSEWQEYNEQMSNIYPEDSVRPQHYMLLMSEDFGRTWKIIYREKAGAINADGVWTIGYFRNGECLLGRVKSVSSSSRSYAKPLIISEGRHKYTSSGVDCDGDIFSRTNVNTIVTPL